MSLSGLHWSGLFVVGGGHWEVPRGLRTTQLTDAGNVGDENAREVTLELVGYPGVGGLRLCT